MRETKARALGNWGEATARAYMERHGYEIVDTQYKTRFGEIDLIMRDGKYLVFIEVKLRKNHDFADARDFVSPAKQKRLRTTATIYLSANDTSLQPRFDVIEIYAPQGEKTHDPEINLIENAF
jgi:putative endonuclease